MTKKTILLVGMVLLLISCKENAVKAGIHVKDITELNAAIAKANPGDDIVMANGVWKDVEIELIGKGEKEQSNNFKSRNRRRSLYRRCFQFRN